MKSYCLVVLLLAGHLLVQPVQAYTWSNCTPAGSTQLNSFAFLPVPMEFGQAVSVVGQLDLARYVPCQCPYRSGIYAIPAPGSTLTLSMQGERFLGQNEYRVKALNHSGLLDACIEATFKVYRCEEPACVPGEPCQPKYCLE